MKSAFTHWANLEAARDDSSMNLNICHRHGSSFVMPAQPVQGGCRLKTRQSSVAINNGTVKAWEKPLTLAYLSLIFPLVGIGLHS